MVRAWTRIKANQAKLTSARAGLSQHSAKSPLFQVGRSSENVLSCCQQLWQRSRYRWWRGAYRWQRDQVLREPADTDTGSTPDRSPLSVRAGRDWKKKGPQNEESPRVSRTYSLTTGSQTGESVAGFAEYFKGAAKVRLVDLLSDSPYGRHGGDQISWGHRGRLLENWTFFFFFFFFH